MRLVVTGSSYMSELIWVFIFQWNNFFQIIRLLLMHNKCVFCWDVCLSAARAAFEIVLNLHFVQIRACIV